MKKHYTFFALAALLLLSFQLKAQSFTFSHNGADYGKHDTVNVTIGHGIMLQVHGINMTNNGPRPTTAKLSCLVQGSAAFDVAGICTSTCLSGNTSEAFTLGSGETYTNMYIEFNIDENIPNGTSATFLLVAFDVSKERADTTNCPYTYLNVTVNDAAINTLQQTAPQISIYPNPSTDYIFVTSDNLASAKEMIIYNVKGDEVIRQKVDNSDQLQVSVNTLPTGTYFCTLNYGDRRSATRKFIVR